MLNRIVGILGVLALAYTISQRSESPVSDASKYPQRAVCYELASGVKESMVIPIQEERIKLLDIMVWDNFPPFHTDGVMRYKDLETEEVKITTRYFRGLLLYREVQLGYWIRVNCMGAASNV